MIDLTRALWLDVEASGLGPDSYPIEVGWCDIDDRRGSVLIRPAPGWTHWQPAAEAIHGIARAHIEAEGVPVTGAAARIAEAVAGRTLYSDNPMMDGLWLARLFAAAGWAEMPVRVEDTVALALSAEGRVSDMGWEQAERVARRIAPITHRAADDARHWATMARVLAGMDLT
jgi:hypothetical protein